MLLFISLLFMLLGLLILGHVTTAAALETTITVSVPAPENAKNINDKLFGHNLCAVSSLWSHTTSDIHRAATKSQIKNLNPTVLRFPGGTHSDLYLWEDGLGFKTTNTLYPAASGDTYINLTASSQDLRGWNNLNDNDLKKVRIYDNKLGQYGQWGDEVTFASVQPVSSTIQKLATVPKNEIFCTHQKNASVRLNWRPDQAWTSELDKDKGLGNSFLNNYGIAENVTLITKGILPSANLMLTVNYFTILNNGGNVSQGPIKADGSLYDNDQRLLRAKAWVAYIHGSKGITKPLGTDREGYNWGTVRSWAQKRVQENPIALKRVYWEIGNEVHMAKDYPGFGGTPTAANYAKHFKQFAEAMTKVKSGLHIGAVGKLYYEDGYDANGNAIQQWNKDLFQDQATSEKMKFLILHPYYPYAETGSGEGKVPSYTHDLWWKAVMAGATQAVRDLKRTYRQGKPLALTEYGIWPYSDKSNKNCSNLASALYNADLLMGLINEFKPEDIIAATAWNLYSGMQTAYLRWEWVKNINDYKYTTTPQYYALEMLRKMKTDVWLQTSSPSTSTLTFDITQRVGNIRHKTHQQDPLPSVPCLAMLASRNSANSCITLAVINRDLYNPIYATIQLPDGFTPSSTTNRHTVTELCYELNGGLLENAHNEDSPNNVTSISTPFTWTSNYGYNFKKHSLTVFEIYK
jgi:alpha-L-arabinofuranosidase